MKQIIAAIIVIIIAESCTKQTDYSYLNTDRRPIIIRVSERHTDPPVEVKDDKGKIKWLPYTFKADTLDRNSRASDYENLIPDTLISTCSIDKVDSSYRIGILRFVVIKF